jgi:menaquinone-dependent protoporphyrinogen oxidase
MSSTVNQNIQANPLIVQAHPLITANIKAARLQFYTMTTLVAYASEHGSTKEIAERFSNIISVKTSPHPVECLAIDDVSDLSKYSYIVIGSCVHNMQWLPAATSFCHHNSVALSKVPVWAFSVGSAAGLPNYLKRWGLPDKEDRNLRDEIERDFKVEGHTFFSGKFLKEQAPAMLRCIWICCGGTFGDFRDWEKIEACGTEVAEAIAQRQSEGAK